MRKIIHVDMDCFFAAVEMRDDPTLNHIPLAIGASARHRGVISTANYPARQYGVHSAMSTAQALKLCPHLKVIPGRMSLYQETSQQIRAIFQRYTPLIEPLSLDEAYLDVSESRHCYGSATLIARQIREDIQQELGLTASAGIAPVKFLAKIASELNKPDGQYVIMPEQVSAFIRDLPLNKIPGVGKVTARRLAELGLHCCQDVQHYPLAKLLRHFGKFGRILWERSQGRDERPICVDRRRKSISVETTLTEDIYQWEQCVEVLESVYVELEKRLLQAKSNRNIASQGVKLKFNDFQQTTQKHSCSRLDKNDLLRAAYQIWQERRNGRGVRLVGLNVSLAYPQIEQQISFVWE